MNEFNEVKNNLFINEDNLHMVNEIKVENDETKLNLNGQQIKIEDFNCIKNEFNNIDIVNNELIKFKFNTVLNVNEFNIDSVNASNLNNKTDLNTNLSGLTGKILNWPSDSWENGPRRSAFQPYKPATVLTNLQRGNIQAKTQHVDVSQFTWHMKAGRGDLRMEDIMNVVDINEKDEHGMTGLMWSSAYGQTSTVQRLLDRGSNPAICGNGRQTALHLAAYGGHHEIIRLLLAYGADVNAVDEGGNTPIMYAVCEDHPHAVYELLLNDADPCVKNNHNMAPYKLAVERNCNQAKIVLEKHIMHVLSTQM